ncbi:Gfo/Idh/MocA family protein [Labrys miyagiensis]|nr:Gfo/Idh/MocA family oxidoreductase [Labrys miyagiensis]
MRLRAVLIGCGAMSRAWLQAAAGIEGLDIVGLADLDQERAKGRAAEFELSHAVTAADLSSLLVTTQPDVLFDVVVPSARHKVVAEALAAGCHVLSEKPMANSMEEAHDLVKRAATAGRIHAVVQNRRYLSAIRRIARLVASGAIGDITSVHADFFVAPHFGGFREEMDHVLLLDMAIHTFDAMRCMTGLSPTKVHCREWDPKSSWFRQGSSALACFDLPNGALFTYRGSWAAEGIRTSWEGAWRIVGTKGSLAWDGHDDIRAEVPGERTELLAPLTSVAVPASEPGDKVGGHQGVLTDFIAAIRSGSEPETVGHENIRSLAMVFGAIESAGRGRTIELVI